MIVEILIVLSVVVQLVEVAGDTQLIYQDENYLIYYLNENNESFHYISPNDGKHLMHGLVSLDRPDIIRMEYMGMIFGSLLLKPKPNRILFLGLGAGILPRTFNKILPDTKIDVVEIDKSIYDLAVEYFAFKSEYSNIKIYFQDAYDYVMSLEELHKYDLIINDVFTTGYCSPEKLTTQLFLNRLKKILNKHGLLVINTIVDCMHNNENMKIYKELFNYLYISEILVSNQIVIASEERFLRYKQVDKIAQDFRWLFSKVGINSTKLPELFHLNEAPHLGACYLRRNKFYENFCYFGD